MAGLVERDLEGLSDQVLGYLQRLPPKVLDVHRLDAVEMLDMYSGAYNLNYHIRADGREYIVRVNIEQQSGLKDQMDYEFQTLEFLEGQGIAPRAIYLDDSKARFEFDLLIEEYLKGPYLRLETEDMPAAADLLARLHSFAPGLRRWIVWVDPLASTYQLALSDLVNYRASAHADPAIVRLSERLLGAIEPQLEDGRRLFHPDGVNHTDLARDNFIQTAQGLRLIDWEKPRVDDTSYDVCCFLSTPAQLWCGPETLSPEAREAFLRAYVAASAKDEALLRQKIRLREPLVSLHWILWGAIKLSDLQDRKTSSALFQAHQEKVTRWNRFARPENIQELLNAM